MKIQNKLFATFLLSSILLVLSLFIATQWALNEGLLKYVNEREQKKLQELAENLSQEYAIQGDWDFLSRRADQSNHFRAKHHGPRGHRPRHERPPHPPGPHHEAPRHRPPPPGEASFFHQADRSHTGSLKLPPHVALFDADKTQIAGRPQEQIEDLNWLPIQLADQTIGWFGTRTPQHLSEDFDLALAEELNQSVLWLSLAVLVLSALAAYPLSYILVKRTKTITRATRQIAKGHFDTRIKDKTRDEIGELAQHFNELALKLANNEATRKRWIADISHELRTPVAIASGELEAMLDGVRSLDKNNLNSAKQEITHLTRLIEDLYQLSNLEIGSLSYNKSEVDFSEIAESCYQKQSDFAESKGFEMSINLPNTPLNLWLDGDRIQQLITNLLNNSIKYTDAPGQIRINLTYSGAKAILTVEDSAPGVPDSDLDKLFEPLYRVENSRNRRHGGSGLGLGICERIASAHGGQMIAEHSTLGGLKISLLLPMNTDGI